MLCTETLGKKRITLATDSSVFKSVPISIDLGMNYSVSNDGKCSIIALQTICTLLSHEGTRIYNRIRGSSNFIPIPIKGNSCHSNLLKLFEPNYGGIY